MRTFKASTCEWREKVMISLNLNYTIANGMIIFKGSIGEYKTFIDMLVQERKKLEIEL